ncbi:hypothetical protein AAMO2058_000687300 [Amorphochlora amoebiformis]
MLARAFVIIAFLVPLVASDYGKVIYGTGYCKDSDVSACKQNLGDAINAGYTWFDLARSYNNLHTVATVLEEKVRGAAKTLDDLTLIYKIKPDLHASFDAKVAEDLFLFMNGKSRTKGFDYVLAHDLRTDASLPTVFTALKNIPTVNATKIGLSNACKDDIDTALEVSGFDDRFEMVSNPWNLFRKEIEHDVLDYCTRNDKIYAGYQIFGDNKEFSQALETAFNGDRFGNCIGGSMKYSAVYYEKNKVCMPDQQTAGVGVPDAMIGEEPFKAEVGKYLAVATMMWSGGYPIINARNIETMKSFKSQESGSLKWFDVVVKVNDSGKTLTDFKFNNGSNKITGPEAKADILNFKRKVFLMDAPSVVENSAPQWYTSLKDDYDTLRSYRSTNLVAAKASDGTERKKIARDWTTLLGKFAQISTTNMNPADMLCQKNTAGHWMPCDQAKATRGEEGVKSIMDILRLDTETMTISVKKKMNQYKDGYRFYIPYAYLHG